MRRIPAGDRATIAGYLRLACAVGSAGGSKPGRSARILERLTNVCDLLPATSDRLFYEQLMSGCREPHVWFEDSDSLPATLSESALWEEMPTLLQRMMGLDFVTYLPDDILVKVDRAAMAVGLETRIPLLDHRIIEFAWQLPESLIQRRGRTKWLLRQILHQYVPRTLVDRPKAGFAVPIAQWLRGSLRPWAEDWLNEGRLREQGVFKSTIVQEKWQEHLSGKRDWSQPLWNVLAFQTWFAEQKVLSRDSELNSDDAVSIRGGERQTAHEVFTF
jgi:asparagine synthase (glutamine-hydrolysing)